MISYLENKKSIKIPNLIKWAGGKNNLAPKLLDMIPESFETYYEPFFGGGSLFWHLKIKGKIEEAVIADTNPELINLLEVLRNQPYDLATEIKNFGGKNEKSSFYEIRTVFNSLIGNPNYTISRAAMFLYLNRNSFNGLWRTNKKGEFNVPFGYYKQYHLATLTEIEVFSKCLEDTMIKLQDYKSTIRNCKIDDFVYFDPPYYKISEGNFTEYGPSLFDTFNQVELVNLFKHLDKIGARLMLTNRQCKEIKSLYSDFDQIVLLNRWPINRNGNKRKNIEEVVITNYKNSKMSV